MRRSFKNKRGPLNLSGAGRKIATQREEAREAMGNEDGGATRMAQRATPSLIRIAWDTGILAIVSNDGLEPDRRPAATRVA